MTEAGLNPAQLHHASPYAHSSSSATPSHHGSSFSAGMINSGLTSRPSSGPDSLRTQQISLPPAPEFKSPTYSYPYGSGSSPTDLVQSGYGDFHPHGSSRAATPGMSSTHLPAIGLHAQKRAYRQRRKDPSCDACRERKVKCDATDTTSCSECSSRNVKCQFTKETNRRMSSIKQVQDLEKQLTQTRKQLHELRSVTKEWDTTKHGPLLHTEKHSRHPETEPRPRSKPVVKQDLSRVRSSLQRVGAGLFKPPFPYCIQAGGQPASPSVLPDLPPRHMADQILGQYHASFHTTLPILHWPSFIEQYENVYRHGSLHTASRIWGALFYAVLGCGTLQRVRQDGQYYLERSQNLLDTWDEDLSLDHARCALLRSIILVELNNKSAGWVCLGTAVRMAQDIGLHCEARSWPSAEDEMRRRVWWSIYMCDRLLSLELGRPGMINDADCEIGLPSSVDDQQIPSTGPWTPPKSSGSPSPLLATFEVIGTITKVLEALRRPTIPTATLQSCDSLFINCIAAFPARHQVNINDYLQPYELAPLIYLQSARLMLHRHNLTPLCPINERTAAIDRCCVVAQDTVQLLARCMQDPPISSSLTSPPSPLKQGTWESHFRSAATTFLSTHLWRCILLFSFRGNYDAALLCARASATIGDARPVNVACGRYLDFFLRRLVAKIQQGEGAYLESDEEMMAYMSGDLQGSIETSWAWQGGEGESLVSPAARSPFIAESGYSPGTGRHTAMREGVIDWAGWDPILDTLGRLAQEQGSQAHRSQAQENAVQLISSKDAQHPKVTPLSSSRISIASII